MLFELIKGLIKDLDGAAQDEVYIKISFLSEFSCKLVFEFRLTLNLLFILHLLLCYILVLGFIYFA